MVRVISVHNFPKQDVTSVDDIVSATVAYPNKLLIAQQNHTILVKCNNKEDATLPTVDQPVSVHYSTRGNYIATLEARGEVRFVRAYIGWESAGGSAPLRARIAGRVTPLSQQTLGVEMLEVPTPAMPDCIAVCPFSGNLLVGSQGVVSIFKYKVQLHDISRMEFVDLVKTNWNLDLGFTPISIQICEDLIAAFSDQYIVLLRIIHRSCCKSQSEVTKSEQDLPMGPIDYNKIVNSPSAVDLDFGTIDLPSVLAESQMRHTPFLTFSDFSPQFTYDCLTKGEQLEAVSLIRMQVVPCQNSGPRRDVADNFICLLLKPSYSCNIDVESTQKGPVLGSPEYSKLKNMTCFFCTQQEGYIYNYLPHSKEATYSAVYPFTAPAVGAVLEDWLLHVLTEAGLETYTLQSFLEDAKCKDHDDPICLLGLRPFLHARKLLLGRQTLFLLASEDVNSAWTVYQLALAEPTTLWADFLTSAEENQWEAPSTYSHLLREANKLLQFRNESLKFALHNNSGKIGFGANFEEATIFVDNLYKQSCVLLADFYLIHDSRDEAFEFYRLSCLKLSDVVKRCRSLHKNVPDQYKTEFDVSLINNALFAIVKKSLELQDERYKSLETNLEEFYNPDIANLVSTAMDVLEKDNPNNVSKVILASPLLQQFSSDRCLLLLKTIEDSQPDVALALALLYLQKGENERAITILSSYDHSAFESLLIENHHVLFDQKNLSDLALAFMEINPKFLAAVLLIITVETKVFDSSLLQKILLELPQKSGPVAKNSYSVLESILEGQLKTWVDRKELSEVCVKEAINTLTFLYLTQLSQRIETAVADADIIFRDCRPKYMDYLPPFGADFSQLLSPQHVSSAQNDDPKTVLLKLQSLLASEPARDCLYRVRVLLCQTPKVFGSLSIQIECAVPAEAVQLLVNFAPQALIAYLQEKQLDDISSKNLLEHIQNKITLAQDSKRKFYYEQLQSNVLEHIAQNTSLERMADLLPPEWPRRNHYLKLAYNQEQAKQMRTLIMLTGNTLL